ncbi:MAG TPA: DNA replication/repair protein RecF [Anaerolineales bacterium]|nr:DNA replication/repair protein RecF [Anaerolineales bacterium]
MYLTHLSLTNFRSFARLDMDIPRRVVLLTGSNAQGKTSVLEAVYFLAAFASFQTHTDRQLVNFIEAKKPLAVGRLVAEYTRGPTAHRLEVRLVLEAVGATGQRLRKEVLLDGVKRPHADVIGHFNAVIFVPQMSQIIEGGPDERRRYLNLALSQTVPGYARQLSEYSEALTQRNALLKTLAERGGDQSQLDYWDETLTRNGASIILRRIEAVQEIEKLAARIHRELTHAAEVLRLNYQPAYDPLPRPEGQLAMPLTTTVQRNGFKEDEIRSGFMEALRNCRAEEIRRGVTVLGPHRDELRFLANGVDLGDYGSRGQTRTALLALKLAEVEWMKAKTGQWPVLLLDEVLAELDTQRRLDLLAYLDKIEQAMLTTTDLKLFSPEFVEKAETWQVESGTIKELGREEMRKDTDKS